MTIFQNGAPSSSDGEKRRVQWKKAWKSVGRKERRAYLALCRKMDPLWVADHFGGLLGLLTA